MLALALASAFSISVNINISIGVGIVLVPWDAVGDFISSHFPQGADTAMMTGFVSSCVMLTLRL
jgi:hypothetical protein